jgi:hypothetical protein
MNGKGRKNRRGTRRPRPETGGRFYWRAAPKTSAANLYGAWDGAALFQNIDVRGADRNYPRQHPVTENQPDARQPQVSGTKSLRDVMQFEVAAYGACALFVPGRSDTFTLDLFTLRCHGCPFPLDDTSMPLKAVL